MSNPRFPYSFHIHEAPVPNEPALLVRNLSGRYPEENAPAVMGLNLRVPVGASIALVGSNGAGKSTLIKLVAGLLPIQSGEVSIFGRPVGNCRHRVAYLAQRSGIDWKFPISVRQLVMGGRYVHLGWFRRASRQDRQLVDAALDRLEAALMAAPYLVGDRLSLADIALVAYTRVAHEGGFDLTKRPALRSWIGRVEADLVIA